MKKNKDDDVVRGLKVPKASPDDKRCNSSQTCPYMIPIRWIEISPWAAELCYNYIAI